MSSYMAISCITHQRSIRTNSKVKLCPVAPSHLASKHHTLSVSLLRKSCHRRPTPYEAKRSYHNHPHQQKIKTHTQVRRSLTVAKHSNTRSPSAGCPLSQTDTRELEVASARQSTSLPETNRWLHAHWSCTSCTSFFQANKTCLKLFVLIFRCLLLHTDDTRNWIPPLSLCTSVALPRAACHDKIMLALHFFNGLAFSMVAIHQFVPYSSPIYTLLYCFDVHVSSDSLVKIVGHQN